MKKLTEMVASGVLAGSLLTQGCATTQIVDDVDRVDPQTGITYTISVTNNVSYFIWGHYLIPEAIFNPASALFPSSDEDIHKYLEQPQ